jgi:hypothetical protein
MYYTIVVIIAIILLIGGLTAVGITLTNNMNNIPFPDYQNTCPDYWTVSTSGNGNNICNPPMSGINLPISAKFQGDKPSVNHKGVKMNSSGTKIEYIDINSSNWYSLCDKRDWANNNGILWDGILNNNSC